MLYVYNVQLTQLDDFAKSKLYLTQANTKHIQQNLNKTTVHCWSYTYFFKSVRWTIILVFWWKSYVCFLHWTHRMSGACIALAAYTDNPGCRVHEIVPAVVGSLIVFSVFFSFYAMALSAFFNLCVWMSLRYMLLSFSSNQFLRFKLREIW